MYQKKYYAVKNLSLNICDIYLYSNFDNMRQIAFSQIQDLSYEITFPCGAKHYNGKDARTLLFYFFTKRCKYIPHFWKNMNGNILY